MKKTAFTLVELLVVIAVIAILASLALPVYLKVLEKGKLTADINNFHQIGIGLQSYENDTNGQLPPDGTAGSFIISAQATNQVIFNYTGKSFAVWHSKFDPREGAEGDSYPVSYSINQKVLMPTSSGLAPGAWTGDLGMAVVAPSKLLVASPCFTGSPNGGTAAWGNNVASMVTALKKAQAQNMTLVGTCYRQMPCLFADSHVSLIPAVNYQNGPGGTVADYVEWDPMIPNVPPGP